MPTAGIEIINDAGTVLIDDSYCNLCVTDSGTGAPSGSHSLLVQAENGWFGFNAPPAAVNDAKLVIYRADGSVAFDSSGQYARAVGNVLSGSSIPGSPLTYTYPAGRVYGVATLRQGLRSHIVVTGMPGAYYFHWVYVTTEASVAGNIITIQQATRAGDDIGPFSVEPQPAEFGNPAWAYVVVDVTGY